MIGQSVAPGLLSFDPARGRGSRDWLGLLFGWLAWFWLAGGVCLACGPKVDNSRVRLPAPMESTTLGPGDLFTLDVVGEKDLPREFQVASDGTVDFPYVHRLEVQGLEPQQVARTVRELLVEKRILTDPSVIVSVKEYNSKRVTVLGQVSKPGSFTCELSTLGPHARPKAQAR